MVKIRCPHLLNRVAYRCCTVDETYCPSNFQLRAYCTDARYRICPFYLGLQARRLEEKGGDVSGHKLTTAD